MRLVFLAFTLITGLIFPTFSTFNLDEKIYQSADFASTSSIRCSELYTEQSPKRTWLQRQTLGFNSQYAFRRSYEKRASPIVRGRYDEIFQTQYPELEGAVGETTIVMGYRTRQVAKNINVPGTDFQSELFSQVASKAVDFVIETYSARRPHWTPEFLRKLRKTAQEYLRESTYIIAQDGVGYDPAGRIHGTLRLIKEKNGLIPMEKYLGIEVNVGNKLKVEPGNFAVDKTYNDEAWPEVIMHLLSQSAKNLGEGRQNHYMTYADRYSLLLYSQLGFKPIDPARFKLLRSDVQIENGKILANGIWWTPMEASQETLDQLLHVHTDRLRRRGHNEEEISALLDRQKEVDDNPMHSLESRYLRGTGSIDGTAYPIELEIGRGQKNLFVRMKSSRDEVPIVLIEIPEKMLPLKNGNIELDNQSILYKDDQLTVRRFDRDSVTEITMTTMPDFKLVQSVHVTTEKAGKTEEMRFLF